MRLRQVRGIKMCSHIWKTVNDIKVCVRCGLTKTFDGRILFDRKIANFNPMKKKKKKKGGK